ncbi:16S rRNA (uracil(1498)-N(3))-methyltransferase [Dendrosporobacter sp. 1207_IL3150]|uniref:16S rRNA (uracil(1498)-N(3))-methyltransferase n=1 Tax=Dendrosporobacter sp. 1207_IL3150 TaxID=3084054 RepID=UPI002FDB41CC
MRRFFIPNPLTSELIINGEDAHHISRVLRMRPSDKILVIDPEGKVAVTEIFCITENQVSCKVCEIVSEYSESPIKVNLAQCLPKSDKMDYIVQKAVELGVTNIYPIAAERSVVKYDKNKQTARQERWQKIAVEASKQCRRSIVPKVEPIQDIASMLSALDEKTVVIMLYEGIAQQGLKNLLAECHAKEYLILIGPEGGFSSDEVKLCEQHKVHTVSIGPRILRTETASLAAVSIVLYDKGDLGGS